MLGVPRKVCSLLWCSEVNFASVSRHLVVRLCASTHISISMQGCLSYRRPGDGERYIFVGDGKSVEVEAIGHFRLLLGTGFYLGLKDTFIAQSFRWNLVSISVLDKFGYHCSFENNQFGLSLNSNIVVLLHSVFMTIFICLTRLHHIIKSCLWIHMVQNII